DVLDVEPEVLEIGGGAPARDERPAEPPEPLRDRGERRLVVRRDQRAHSSRTTFGSSVCSTRLIRSCRVSTVSPSSTGTVSCARIGPLSTPASTGGPGAPPSVTPAASCSSTACAPGKLGSREGWTLTIAPGKASRNGLV